jgi:four helix bundle protein
MCMAISDHRNLQCWQLAQQLRAEVSAVCERENVFRDSRFCNEFRAAAGRSAGIWLKRFRRFESVFIVQFFGYALGSLGEVQDCLEECRLRKVITQEEFDRLTDMAEHTRAVGTPSTLARWHVEHVRT